MRRLVPKRACRRLPGNHPDKGSQPSTQTPFRFVQFESRHRRPKIAWVGIVNPKDASSAPASTRRPAAQKIGVCTSYDEVSSTSGSGTLVAHAGFAMEIAHAASLS